MNIGTGTKARSPRELVWSAPLLGAGRRCRSGAGSALWSPEGPGHTDLRTLSPETTPSQLAQALGKAPGLQTAIDD